MFLSRIPVALLLTVLGCQQFAHWVTAFGRSTLPRSACGLPTKSKLSVASEGGVEEEVIDEVKASRDELIDDAVLLYSIVSQREKFDGSTEGEQDILTLRGNELASLIEDAVFDGLVVDESSSSSTSTTIVEEPKEQPQTVGDISNALDEQILLGYQAEFTEDELEDWIERINGLQQTLQSQLAALPPTSDRSDSAEAAIVLAKAPTPAPAPSTPLNRFHARLESLQTLIDPEGSSRMRVPLTLLALPSVVVEPPATPTGPTPPEPSANSEIKAEVEIQSTPSSPENLAPTKLDIENAFIESINKAAVESTSSTNTNTDDTPVTEGPSEIKTTLSEIDLENAFIESINKATVESTSRLNTNTVSVTSPEDLVIHDDENNDEEKSIDTTESMLLNAPSGLLDDIEIGTTLSEIDIENAFIESINKAAAESISSINTNTVSVPSPEDLVILDDEAVQQNNDAEENIDTTESMLLNAPSGLLDDMISLNMDNENVESEPIAEISKVDEEKRIDTEKILLNPPEFFDDMTFLNIDSEKVESEPIVEASKANEENSIETESMILNAPAGLLDDFTPLKADGENVESEPIAEISRVDEEKIVTVSENNDGDKSVDTESILLNVPAGILDDMKSLNIEGVRFEPEPVVEVSKVDDDSAIKEKEEKLKETKVMVQENSDADKSIDTKSMLLNAPAGLLDDFPFLAEGPQASASTPPSPNKVEAIATLTSDLAYSFSLVPTSSLTDGDKSEAAEISTTEEFNTTTIDNNNYTSTDITDDNNTKEPPADFAASLVQHYKSTAKDRKDETDVVSPLFATAVLGAAAATANPLLIGGIVLGPVIRDAIATAKDRTKKRSNKTAAKSKNKASKPKVKSMFEVKKKPAAKPTPKTKIKARSVFDKKKKKKKNSGTGDNGDESKSN